MNDTNDETIETPYVTTDPETPYRPLRTPYSHRRPTRSPQGRQDDDAGDKGNREAAKYRRKLRDAEAQRDTALTRVESMQGGEAERLAGKHLAKGAALWVGGTALAELLDDDGNVEAPARSSPRTSCASGSSPNSTQWTPRPGRRIMIARSTI